jgi:hypothetical protein
MVDMKQAFRAEKTFEEAVRNYKSRHTDATDEDIDLIIREGADLDNFLLFGFSKEDEEDVRIMVQKQPKLAPALTPADKSVDGGTRLSNRKRQNVRFEQSTPSTPPAAAAQPQQQQKQESPASAFFPFSLFDVTSNPKNASSPAPPSPTFARDAAASPAAPPTPTLTPAPAAAPRDTADPRYCPIYPVHEYEQDIFKLKAQLKASEDAAEILRKQGEDAELRHRTLQKEHDELAAVHSRCGTVWRDLASTQSALSGLQDEYRNVKDECHQLRSAAASDKEEVAKWQQEAARVRDQMQRFVGDEGAPHTASEIISKLEAQALKDRLELEKLRQKVIDGNRSISNLVVRVCVCVCCRGARPWADCQPAFNVFTS